MPTPGDPPPRPSRLERPLRSARRSIDLWEPVAKPEGPTDWFDASAGMPPFDPGLADFSPANAWWLASLCRLAYTPDEKESRRPWHRDKPPRLEFLEGRTPFRESLNVHKTGNHAAIYQLADGPGAVVCFRGTNKLRQWIMNLTALPVPWRGDDRGVLVHQGFRLLFNRVWSLIEPCLIGIDGPVVLTGHSLGAAFATLAAAALPEPPAALVTFGSPRVGNAAFVDRLAQRAFPHHRVVNQHDIVTQLPQREPRLGGRDYRHGARPIILGKEPGSIFFGEVPDDHLDPLWRPDQPLSWFAQTLGGPEPPEGVLAHLPTAYEAKLLALARGI
jgi:triacylglycerol lipase